MLWQSSTLNHRIQWVFLFVNTIINKIKKAFCFYTYF